MYQFVFGSPASPVLKTTIVAVLQNVRIVSVHAGPEKPYRNSPSAFSNALSTRFLWFPQVFCRFFRFLWFSESRKGNFMGFLCLAAPSDARTPRHSLSS
jgi:hypothetical protein